MKIQHSRLVARALVGGLVLLFFAVAVRATVDIPDVPLYMNSVGVKPNFLITLDDSGSMQWADAPDDRYAYNRNNFYKSSSFNAIYYDPRVQYHPPPKYNRPVSSPDCSLSVDSVDCYPNASFARTYINGFDSTRGSVNLGTDYRAVTDYEPSSTGQAFAGSPLGSSDRSYYALPSSSPTAYPAYYYLFYTQAGLVKPTACTSTLDKQLTDDDCYVRIWVGDTTDIYKNPDASAATAAQKKQNFANWYSYYRTRNLAMVSGAMSALNSLDGSVRVAWQALNTCNTFSASSCKGWDSPKTGVDNRMRALDEVVTGSETHRKQLYDWLSRFPAEGSTPLVNAARNAGRYFDTTVTPLSASSPWAEQPPRVAGSYHGCRRSVHLLMTDGIWNDSVDGVGNATNSSITLPTGSRMPNGASTWTPGYPYTDASSNTLADVAMHFWSRDLAPTLDNKLPPLFTDRSGSATTQWTNPKNNPATWQHLNTYAISLGLSSVLVAPNPVWGGSTYSGDYSSLLSGAKAWPAAGPDKSPGNAYDLWHAALAGRGQFFSAESSDALKKAFRSVVDSVTTLASAGGGAGLVANSTRLSTNTAVFLSTYSGDWSGSFQSVPLQTDGSLGTMNWDASQRMPYAAHRNLFTLNNGVAQPFSGCTGALGTALNADLNGVVDKLCSQRLAWLRGSQQITGATWSASSQKATFMVPGHGFVSGDTVVVSNVTPSAYNGTFSVTVDGNALSVNLPLAADPGAMAATTTGLAHYANFRQRASTVLGDIMNSTPAYSHTEDHGYGGSRSSVAGSASYRAFVSSKSSRTPMVFVGANDGMLHAFNAESSGSNAGKELFAYVPAGVYANLSKLTSPNYSHQFFVDGSPTVGDAYLNGWRTYLVGGLGAGGKSLFALDITNASQFANTAFDIASFDPATLVKWEFTEQDLGVLQSQPQIVPNTATQWAAVFGNGYNGSTDRAYLYVVNLATGALIAKVAAGTDTSNGLSAPYLYDNNGDKIPDVAYAGDLKGNLWKFVNTNGVWSLGNGGNPLARAVSSSGVSQPITAAPTSLPHPNGGIMLYFGTGSYMTNADLTNTTTQSFYGVWDNGTTNSAFTRSNLQQQTLTESGDFRTATANVIDWSTKRGCFMDLPAGSPSERILTSPQAKDFSVLQDRVIFISSKPTADPCDRGGTSWLQELNAMCGQLEDPAMDTNADNAVNASDEPKAGMRLSSTVGMVLSRFLWLNSDGSGTDATGKSCVGGGCARKFIPGSSGVTAAPIQTDDPRKNALTVKRIYWKQIL